MVCISAADARLSSFDEHFVAQAGGGFQPILGSQSLSQTMSNLLQSDIVANQAIKDLGLDTTPEKLRKKLKVSFKPDSSVLDVSYDSPQKPLAVAVLGSIAGEYTRLVDEKLGVRYRGTARGKQPLSIIVAKVFDPRICRKSGFRRSRRRISVSRLPWGSCWGSSWQSLERALMTGFVVDATRRNGSVLW